MVSKCSSRSAYGSDARVRPGQDPLHVRIVGGIQLGEGVLGALEQPRRHVARHVAEELGIAAEATQYRAREEQPEQRPPSPRVPSLAIEPPPLVDRSFLQQRVHHEAAMDQREHARPEQGEVPLEPSGTADPLGDGAGPRVPDGAGIGRERQPAARVERRAPGRRPRSDQLEDLVVVERPERRHPQLEAGQLACAQIDGHHALRLLRQQRKRVVPGRPDRHAHLPWPHVERLEEHVGVLPHLGVADAREIHARRGFTPHAQPPLCGRSESCRRRRRRRRRPRRGAIR